MHWNAQNDNMQPPATFTFLQVITLPKSSLQSAVTTLSYIMQEPACWGDCTQPQLCSVIC